MTGPIRSFEVRERWIHAPLPHEGYPFDFGCWPVTGDYGEACWDEAHYSQMEEDRARNALYRAAIEKLVPGRTAVDIGTGANLLWARACIEAGATKVYAIEGKKETFDLAQSELKPEEPIELLFGLSTDVELPERVDVCVSEIIGEIASSEGAIPYLEDARRRFLKPDGRFIPERCVSPIAAIRLPEEFVSRPHFCEEGAFYLQKVFQHFGRPFDVRLDLGPDLRQIHRISTEGIFEDLDWTEPIESEYSNPIDLEITESGPFHGFVVWIRLECLKSGQLLDTLEELDEPTNWAPVFFPAFFPGIEVRAGERIVGDCVTTMLAGASGPDYRIEGSLLRLDGSEISICCDSPLQARGYRENPFHAALLPEDWRFSDS